MVSVLTLSSQLYLPLIYLFLSGFIEAILQSLQDSLSEISVELIPIHDKLVTLRRQLIALAAKENPSKADLKPLQEELRRIDQFST